MKIRTSTENEEMIMIGEILNSDLYDGLMDKYGDIFSIEHNELKKEYMKIMRNKKLNSL